MSSPRAAVLQAFAKHRCSAILRTNDREVVRPALEAAIAAGQPVPGAPADAAGAAGLPANPAVPNPAVPNPAVPNPAAANPAAANPAQP